jgi:hypothetical protein
VSSDPIAETAPVQVLRVYRVMETEGTHLRELGDYVDDVDRAHRHARTVGGVLVVESYEVLADYRPKDAS